jgi:multimeric flavodoxin WrbA
MDNLKKLYNYLKKKKDKKIVFLTTSNRWEGDNELPKSSIIADELIKKLGSDRIELINVAKLKIFPCEGNVSTKRGNTCGLKEAKLDDKEKNPTGHIRCWASLNNKSDEMYKVANAILDADIVIFFGSIRWGKMNAIYTQLIERLTWLENRHTTLGESNLLKDKEAGVIAVGQNWNGKESVKLEKEVLDFFGFKTPNELSFNWQYLKDPNVAVEQPGKRHIDDTVGVIAGAADVVEYNTPEKKEGDVSKVIDIKTTNKEDISIIKSAIEKGGDDMLMELKIT